MPRSRRRLVGCIALAGLILAAEPASAEWFADLYVGGGFTPSTNVSVATESIPIDDVSLPGLPVAIDLPSVPLRLDLDDVGTDDFVAFGIRLGRWFEAVPDVGLALDVFHFAPEIRAQTVGATAAADLGPVIDDPPIDVVPGVSGPVRLPDIELSATAVVSFDVMLRRPLLRTPSSRTAACSRTSAWDRRCCSRTPSPTSPSESRSAAASPGSFTRASPSSASTASPTSAPKWRSKG